MSQGCDGETKHRCGRRDGPCSGQRECGARKGWCSEVTLWGGSSGLARWEMTHLCLDVTAGVVSVLGWRQLATLKVQRPRGVFVASPQGLARQSVVIRPAASASPIPTPELARKADFQVPALPDLQGHRL